MSGSTRRDLLTKAAAAGAAAIGVSAAASAQEPKGKKPRKGNDEAPVHSKASPDEHGPREMFAVVDADGTLRRGMHVAACGAVDIGIYEVIFKRDVRRGVYLATIGGHGYEGLPPTGYVSVQGRSTNPRAVLVSTASAQGENVNMGFHLLVVCPDGYA
jgi:hypothetical protein